MNDLPKDSLKFYELDGKMMNLPETDWLSWSISPNWIFKLFCSWSQSLKSHDLNFYESQQNLELQMSSINYEKAVDLYKNSCFTEQYTSKYLFLK